MEINLTTFRELADLGPLRNALRATRTMKRQNEKVISVPQLSTSEIEEQVKSYQNWLTADADYNLAQRQSNDRLEYIEAAQQTVKLGSRTIRAFAPFNYDVSAVTTITKNQRIVVGIVLLTIAIGLILFGWYMLSLLIAALTVFYFGNLILTLGLSAKTLDEQVELNIEDEVVHALADAEWPRYTILCPLYKEAAVVPQFAEAMGELDYPIDKLQILFLTEEDDNETREAILAQELPSHFQIVVVPDGEPRTKPRACNYGLLMADGDYLVIFDAEDKPDPLQLKKAVLAFANCGPELGCVQAKLNFYNPTQNVLTRWFNIEPFPYVHANDVRRVGPVQCH